MFHLASHCLLPLLLYALPHPQHSLLSGTLPRTSQPFCYCCPSVSKSCVTLCDCMNCSVPESPVLHYILEFAQIQSTESVMLSDHLILCCPLLLLPQSFPASGSFPMRDFVSGAQTIGAPASAFILLVNIQDWFPSGLTGLISLLSKGFSRVFSSTTVIKHQFFSAQPSFWSNSHSCTWPLEKP